MRPTLNPQGNATAPFDTCFPATFSGTSFPGLASDRTALSKTTPPYALGGGGGGV
jgi:hypothetical protein